MPDDNTPPIDQQATGKPRRIRHDLAAVDQGDGVVSLQPVRVVPSALWRSPLWRHCALPDWACAITEPANQFLVLTISLASQKQETIDALRATLDDLRAVRRQIAALGAKEVVGPVDEVGKRIRAIVEDLDR
jgi:hypothetical protein